MVYILYNLKAQRPRARVGFVLYYTNHEDSVRF